MKATHTTHLAGLCLAGLLTAGTTAFSADPTPAPQAPTEKARPADEKPTDTDPAKPAVAKTDADKSAPAEVAPDETPAKVTPEVPVKPVPPGERGLRLNFRGAPLEMVLNYLSEAAGFIINLETEVRGKVDVWSNQPLNQDEAVELLNTVLGRNGYAALRNGRTLTIVSRDDAKKRDIPVISGNIPDKIPKSEEIVTQIIPVRFISATQLTKDLQQLLPSTATMTANEGGNALVVTDSQVNIRRMAEIVQALDQAIASVSSLSVFTLKYADAKSVATTLTSLFQNQDSSRNNNQNGPGRFFNAFRGGGGPGGFPGGPGGGGADAGSTGNGRAPTPRVIAVADERSNSVVVSAPEDQMTVIKGVVEQIDRDIEQITELRVFRLKFADPQETADLLSQLFQDPTSSQSQNQRGQQVQFGGMFGGGRGGAGGGMGMFGGNRGGASTQSSRMQQQTRVTAVPDMRTGSVVVSASKELMDQIGRMIEQLDSDPAKKQKVFVYSVENTDPEAVQQLIQTLFPEQNNSSMRNNRTTQRQNANQLNNRTTQNNNQGNRSGNSGSFGSSFGNTQGR